MSAFFVLADSKKQSACFRGIHRCESNLILCFQPKGRHKKTFSGNFTGSAVYIEFLIHVNVPVHNNLLFIFAVNHKVLILCKDFFDAVQYHFLKYLVFLHSFKAHTA